MPTTEPVDAMQTQETPLHSRSLEDVIFVHDVELDNASVMNRHLIKDLLALCQEQGLDENLLFKIHLGLDEALSNAVTHGNLEMESPEFRTHDNFSSWDSEIKRRLNLTPFCTRKIHLHLEIDSKHCVLIRVQDDGEGFDHRSVLRGLPEDIYQPHGRGLAMLGMVAKIDFNEKGNCITIYYNSEA